jgi:hypothetical protein
VLGGKICTRCGFVEQFMTLTLVIFTFPTSNPENLTTGGSISIKPFVPMRSKLSIAILEKVSSVKCGKSNRFTFFSKSIFAQHLGLFYKVTRNL